MGSRFAVSRDTGFSAPGHTWVHPNPVYQRQCRIGREPNHLFDEVPTNGAEFLKEGRHERITPNVFNILPRFNKFSQEAIWIQEHGLNMRLTVSIAGKAELIHLAPRIKKPVSDKTTYREVGHVCAISTKSHYCFKKGHCG